MHESVLQSLSYQMMGQSSSIVRVDCHVGPPVPIPNTEVKHMYADDSCRVTGRENR